jgi:hypothetical protein
MGRYRTQKMHSPEVGMSSEFVEKKAIVARAK